MSGFASPDHDSAVEYSALWAKPPAGEPAFVFLREDGEGMVLQTATLEWVREAYHRYFQDDSEVPVDYREAYILIEGGGSLQRCDLGTVGGAKPGDGPRILVSNEYGVLALYDI